MCGLDLASEPRLPTADEYLARRHDEQWRAAHGERRPFWSGVSRGVWLAVGFLVVMVAGGFGPWATAFGLVSINGTRGDGWLVIGAAAIGAVVLGLWLRRPTRWWLLLVLGVCGLVGAGVAGYDLRELRNVSGDEFFGQRVKLVSPAWGVYAALGGSALLSIASVALLVETVRPRRSVALRAVVGVAGALAVLNAAGSIVLAAGVDPGRAGKPTPNVDHAVRPSSPAAPATTAPAVAEDAPPADVAPEAVTEDEVRTVLDLYSSAYEAEDPASLSALFAPGFVRHSVGEAPQSRGGALAVYRKQFAQLEAPAYVLSHLALRDATSDGATIEARYSITSQNGTVHGSITFELVRQGGELLISRLDVVPD
jgi:hypothetical protein